LIGVVNSEVVGLASGFVGGPIEILGATLEEACLKKGDFFQLISTLFCEVKRGFVDC
jgi:hypothetical protein